MEKERKSERRRKIERERERERVTVVGSVLLPIVNHTAYRRIGRSICGPRGIENSLAIFHTLTPRRTFLLYPRSR